MRVLVTGGAGYIGSHVAHELIDRGYEVVVLDDLSTGLARLVPDAATLVVGDIADELALDEAFSHGVIDAVLHFAGSVIVPESVAAPLKYYFNNAMKSGRLVHYCLTKGTTRLVYSSTAAVYGEPDQVPVSESAPTRPINPYGRSKLVTEWMLADAAHAHGLQYLALRYFNVAGADPAGRTGQATPKATHLVKVAVEAALGVRPRLTIFGTDYPTPDGTGIRDYIHVSDLAEIHVLALEELLTGGASGVLNCGYGEGRSVREVVDAVARVSGREFRVDEGPRRDGDSAQIIADPSALRQRFQWTPSHADLDHVVETALSWEKKLRSHSGEP
jgi:UDP-glucose 4-epimerase